jgi:hypothetical protein
MLFLPDITTRILSNPGQQRVLEKENACCKFIGLLLFDSKTMDVLMLEMHGILIWPEIWPISKSDTGYADSAESGTTTTVTVGKDKAYYEFIGLLGY